MSKAPILFESRQEKVPGGAKTTWTITILPEPRSFTWPMQQQRVPLWRRVLKFLVRR
jgi:hypothetical protein